MVKPVNVFILAAGEATRLFPFSAVIPKSLLPIGHKPCITWIVDWLTNAGFDNIYVCCLYKDVRLFQHEFRDRKEEVHILSTAEPQGTAGQLETGKSNDLLGMNFIVWYGDCLVKCDIKSVYEHHIASGVHATLVVTTKAQLEYGVVDLDPAAKITEFREKPWVEKCTWTGVAVLNHSVSKYLKPNKDFGSDVFPEMVKDGLNLRAHVINSPWYDIGNYPAYKRVNDLALSGVLY